MCRSVRIASSTSAALLLVCVAPKAGSAERSRLDIDIEVAADELRTAPLSKPSGELWLYSLHLHEEVRVSLYDERGDIDHAALAAVDHTLRCRKTGTERAFDPRLLENLSRIYDQFGKRRIEVVSGFRNQENEGSRHYHASAVDIRIDGVEPRELFDFAQTLDTGDMGIGLYPVSRFVHVDFRAPGADSARWIDYSRPGKAHRHRRRGGRHTYRRTRRYSRMRARRLRAGQKRIRHKRARKSDGPPRMARTRRRYGGGRVSRRSKSQTRWVRRGSTARKKVRRRRPPRRRVRRR